jgi:hypothetical protein
MLYLAFATVGVVAALVAFIIWKFPSLKHAKFTATVLKVITLSFEFTSHPPES